MVQVGAALYKMGLEEIARDASVESRGQLLTSLSDLVFDQRRPTADEVVLLCDVARLLLKAVDPSVRSYFASVIAPSAFVPRDVVFLLIDDEPPVATPLLRYSPILTDADLLTIAEEKPDPYLAAIAARSRVGEHLVEILVRRGSRFVQIALVENSGAYLSSGALSALVAKAETDEDICRSLVRRPEVPKADAERLVHRIAEMLKARMSANKLAWSQKSEALSLAAARRARLANAQVAEIVAMVESGSEGIDEVVKMLAEQDRVNDLSMLVSALTHVESMYVMRLLVREDANGIAILLKALGVTSKAYACVAHARRRRLKHTDNKFRFEQEDFLKLSQIEAQGILAQLLSGSPEPI
ncbi:MAG: DUF2336 domain-containing protein [Ancalomicrobiaceae bacterium]|nr:DUF2336 domain-containing protein [Ancalomicrobiaceae bacterium]